MDSSSTTASTSAPQTVAAAVAAASPSCTPRSSPRHPGNGSDTSSPSSVPAFRQNGHKSCDACKMRKVKCPNINYPSPCGNCVRRKEACHFGTKKVPRRNVTKHLRFAQPCATQNEPASGTMLCYVDAPSSAGSLPHVGPERDERDGPDLIPTLYVDHMLAQAQARAQTRDKEAALVKGNGIFGGSYSLTFFSETRLLSLSTRLRNNKVNELVRRINVIISGRLRRSNEASAHEAATNSTGTGTGAGAVTGGTGGTGGAGNGSRHSVGTGADPTLSIASVMDNTPPMPVDPAFAAACIRYYFDRVHKLYPFLDRAAFEAKALPAPGSGEDGEKALAKSLARSKAWSCLYYTVLAIGCVYSEGAGSGSLGVKMGSNSASGVAMDSSSSSSAAAAGAGASVAQSFALGSFEPGKGTAWRFFSMALVNLSDLFILPDSLLTLQALTAMVIYGLGVSCMSIERVILSEASRRAQSLASNFGTSDSTPSSATFQRTFWVLYGIEKIMSFHLGRSSNFIDSDIACPIPAHMDSTGDGDSDDDNDDDGGGDDSNVSINTITGCWFLLSVRHARLLSRTYSSLFSVGTARVSAANNLATIDQLCDETEAWRMAIPSMRGLRPECSSWRSSTAKNTLADMHSEYGSSKTSMALRSTILTERNIALGLRFLYHSLVVVLARAKLHHLALFQAEMDQDKTTPPDARERTVVDVRSQEADARRGLMTSARGILELTPTIDVEPYMPLWVLAVIPLTALFVLFDLVVDHPGDTAYPHGPHSVQIVQASGPRTISSDTTLNLALLDMGAGYFSRIEYASNSSLPGSLISEFAHIARDYVNDYQRGVRSVHAPLPPPPPPPPPLENACRDPQDDEGPDVLQPITLMQSTTRMLPQQPVQRPLPLPILTHEQQQQQQQQQQQPDAALQHRQANPEAAGHPISLMDTSLAGWPASSGVTSTDGSMPLVGAPSVDSFDGLGYGFGTDPYQPGSADFGGTDVMGLFTSNHYFWPDMDGIMYNGL